MAKILLVMRKVFGFARLSKSAAIILFRDGPNAFLRRLNQKVSSWDRGREYERWIAEFDTLSDDDIRMILFRIKAMKSTPLISVLMPVFNVEENWLRRAIESVRAQIYTNWELCIADDCSSLPHVQAILKEFESKDARIRVVYRSENGHISAASNSALELVRGEYCALMDHDDELSMDALYRVVEEINRYPDASLIYSDEDKIDTKGRRYDPYFKPDWNPDLLYGQNYVCHLTVYRSSLIKELGGFRVGFEGSQDYDLLLRVVEKIKPTAIRHIPEILYHWRAITGSVALGSEEKPYAHAAARRAIQSHFDRLGLPARSTKGYGPLHRARFSVPHPAPKVSIVIATRDRVDLLKNTVEGLLYRTDYFNLEVIIVDNGSSDPSTLAYLQSLNKNPLVQIIRSDTPFNYSYLNNLGVRSATGTIIGLMNNDIEVISSEWLMEVVGHAIRSEVGVVGVKLLYMNSLVQHAGVVLGLVGGIAGHAHKFMNSSEAGYFGRLQVAQNFSAVTGACLFLRREVWDEVGGLDEANLPIAYNDIDICLRIQERGYRILYTPFAELFHLESATRGPDSTLEKSARLHREAEYMKRRWGDVLKNDPAYNPNLTVENEWFALASPPRRVRVWKQGEVSSCRS